MALTALLVMLGIGGVAFGFKVVEQGLEMVESGRKMDGGGTMLLGAGICLGVAGLLPVFGYWLILDGGMASMLALLPV